MFLIFFQNFIDAEIDFRKKMELTEEDTTTLFYTGLSQYYRGKVRVCTYQTVTLPKFNSI